MRKTVTKIALVLAIGGMAITSCSSDTNDGSGSGTSSSGTGGNSSPSTGGSSSSVASSGGTSSSSGGQQQGSGDECVIQTPYHQGICPAGSHIPTKEEWDALITAAGGPSVAPKKLRSATGWNYALGTDDYGFAALPGGFCTTTTCTGINTENTTRWWSATEDDATVAFSRMIGTGAASGANVTNSPSVDKKDYSSVRCLQDGASGGDFNAWRKTNMNTTVTGSTCYGNNAANCATYGRLYNWAAAMALPSKCNSTISATPSSSSVGGTQTQSSSSVGGAQNDIGSCVQQLSELLFGLGSCTEGISKSVCDQAADDDVSTSFTAGGVCSTTEYPCCVLQNGDTAEDFGSRYSKEQCKSAGGIMANPAWCAIVPRG